MPEPEVPLPGGHMTAVVRVGETVRRSTGPWSPAVHCLLRHIEAATSDDAPRLLGVDSQGREELTFIDGEAGFFSDERVAPATLWSDEVVIEAGRLLRRLHDATIGLTLPPGVQWHTAWASPPPHEVICHNDFAPYNCIFRAGRPIAAIDFDGAGPGSRAWDLAYAAYTFIPLYTDDRCLAVGFSAPPDRERRLRLLCDAYELPDRAGFVDILEARVTMVATVIQALASAGDARFQRKVDEGHVDGYQRDAAFIHQFRRELQAAIDSKEE